MRKSIQGLSLLLVFAIATTAQADCGNCDQGDEGTAAITTAATEYEAGKCTDGSCPVAAAMEKLPKITFAVGEEKVCCEKMAGELAEKKGGHVHFCVGEQEFDAKADAELALVEATENFVSTFAEPHTCEVSGKVTVAGAEQDCIMCATSLSKKMAAAMEAVHMTYLVGEKECSCPVTAAKLATDAGVDKQFVVGEEKTCCERTARLTLARARYKAAIAVLVEATAKSDSAKQVEATEGQGT